MGSIKANPLLAISLGSVSSSSKLGIAFAVLAIVLIGIWFKYRKH